MKEKSKSTEKKKPKILRGYYCCFVRHRHIDYDGGGDQTQCILHQREMKKAEGNLEVIMKSGALRVWRERNADEVQEEEEGIEEGPRGA